MLTAKDVTTPIIEFLTRKTEALRIELENDKLFASFIKKYTIKKGEMKK